MNNNRKRVDYLPPELEVPENTGLRNIENDEMPELTRENFAKLCRKMTEIQIKRQDVLESIESRLDDIETRLNEAETAVSELRKNLDIQRFQQVKSDIEDIARIISTLKIEAINLEPIKP